MPQIDSDAAWLALPELDFFVHDERAYLINLVYAGATRRTWRMIIASRIWPKLNEEQLQRRVLCIEFGQTMKKPRGEGLNRLIKRTSMHYDNAVNALMRTKVAEQADFARESGDARRAAMHEMLAMTLDRTLEEKDRISAAKAVAALAGKDAVDVAAIAANAGRAELAERLERAAKAGAQAMGESAS